MKFADILSLLPIVISIAIPIFSYFWVKKSKFYFLQKIKVKLYADIIKVFPGISIKYHDTDIQENLILISGTIMLKGHYDIKPEDIDIPLYIQSDDENAVWQEFSIDSSNNDFNPSFSIEGRRITIKKSLLKKNDYFTFWGLIDSKSSVIHIGHRIYNLPSETILLDQAQQNSYKKGIILYSISSFVLLIFSYFIIFKSSLVFPLNNSEVNNNSEQLQHFDFDKIFAQDKKVINVDSIKMSLAKFDSINKVNRLSEYVRISDSLLSIVKDNPSFENKFKLRDYQALNFANSLESLVDPYRFIEAQSDTLINNRLKEKNLELEHYYKINDSITVKFLKKRYLHTENPHNYFLLSMLIMFNIIFLFMIAYYTYRFYLIYRVTKISTKN